VGKACISEGPFRVIHSTLTGYLLPRTQVAVSGPLGGVGDGDDFIDLRARPEPAGLSLGGDSGYGLLPRRGRGGEHRG
jgi:hypothetical protein